MKKLQLVAVIMVVFVVAGPVFSGEKKYDEFHEVAERIKISNLINAMSLDVGQVKYILGRAYEATKYRKEAWAEIEKYYRDFLEACENLEDEVMEGRVVVEKKTAKDFHQTKKKIEDIKYDLEKKLILLAGDIKDHLGEYQIIAVGQFTPCLVPKVQEGRVGQEGGNKHILKMLERIRSLPIHAYNNKKQMIINRVVTRTEERLPFLTEKEVQAYKEKIETVFDKIRGLDDVDFSIQKAEIAQNLKNSLKPQKRFQKPKEKIKKFLLSEQAIEVLKKKLG